MDGLHPPPVHLGTSVAVPVDIEQVDATLRFDVAARVATADVRVELLVGPERGSPVLDLRQAIDGLTLDGRRMPADAFAHRDLGGGPGADMRVLDAVLEAGSRHVLELTYPLATPEAEGAEPIGWGDGSVRFDLWMSDLYPGRYLEMWLPANLCHDRFRLSLDVDIHGADTAHAVLSNGAGQPAGATGTRVAYPPRFTSLSPMLVVAPAAELEIRRRTVELAGRAGPLRMVTAALVEAEADVAACEDDIAGWLAHLAVRYGPWVHGNWFTTVIWGPGRGMEYDGATTASVRALEHEVFHSWFGRGVKPARASDGWIDEAWTTWCTASSRYEGPRFAVEELGLDEDPVLLCPPHPWSRATPVASYRHGARLFAGLAHRLGGADRLRTAMAAWYRHHAGDLVSTEGLEAHLTGWSGTDVGPWFRRYVHGQG